MLDVGQTVPDFELPNQDGQPVKLSDFRGKRVVIFAFPKAGTRGCTNQACSFRDEFPQIETKNAVVLGISGDAPEALKTWKDSKKLQYDLLSDTQHDALEMLGAWGQSLLGLIKVPVAQRSYWVIDENGVLVDQQVGVGPEESVRKAMATLDKMQTASA